MGEGGLLVRWMDGWKSFLITVPVVVSASIIDKIGATTYFQEWPQYAEGPSESG